MDYKLREIRIGESSGGISALVERVPAVCGVYAWFRSIDIGQCDDGAAYFDALVKRATHVYGVQRNSFLGPSFEVTLVPRTDMTKRDLPKLRAACDNEDFRAWMTNALTSIATFLPPLYVGAASNLRTRISTHLKPGSLLRTRLDHANIAMEEVILRYVMLPDIGEDAEDLDKEVECVIAHMLVPGFSVRYG